MTDNKKITLDADVAAWLAAIVFPDPTTGRTGAQVAGIPGTPEFDNATELFIRARNQLGA